MGLKPPARSTCAANMSSTAACSMRACRAALSRTLSWSTHSASARALGAHCTSATKRNSCCRAEWRLRCSACFLQGGRVGGLQ
eukprot:11934-Chlamydomonas_euryale.AAC.1